MVGGVTGVTADVIPYGFVFGPRARLAGLNIVGLRRRGLDKTQLHRVRAAYKFLFAGPGVFAERVAEAAYKFEDDQYVTEMLEFISHPSRHGLITTLSRATGEDEG
jgi:UDP-N-acetylglucosamine acyltransferase